MTNGIRTFEGSLNHLHKKLPLGSKKQTGFAPLLRQLSTPNTQMSLVSNALRQELTQLILQLLGKLCHSIRLEDVQGHECSRISHGGEVQSLREDRKANPPKQQLLGRIALYVNTVTPLHEQLGAVAAIHFENRVAAPSGRLRENILQLS